MEICEYRMVRFEHWCKEGDGDESSWCTVKRWMLTVIGIKYEL